MESEKRKFRRLVGEFLAFAVNSRKRKKLIRITDISRGGLACEYVIHKKIAKDFTGSEVNILLSGNSFYMSRIPFNVVYDIKMGKDEYAFENNMERRQWGLKLGKVTKDQVKKFNVFFKEYVGGTI